MNNGAMFGIVLFILPLVSSLIVSFLIESGMKKAKMVFTKKVQVHTKNETTQTKRIIKTNKYYSMQNTTLK